MGVVYRAQDRWSGTTCAVKVLETSTDARRFLREAQILSRLSHPTVVRYVGHGVSPSGLLFLAMEWVEGRDLERALAERPLTVAETIRLGERLAQALSVVHDAGIVHRDMKPSNVFLPQGKLELAKLGDFGIAYQSSTQHPSTRLTNSGVIMGTPGYLAPELLRHGVVSARADLFGLGCILFQCVTGRPAFYADSVLALIAKIALDQAPSAREACADVPLDLDRLITALLAKQPDARPESALAVRDALARVQLVTPRSSGPGTLPSLIGTQERRLVTILVCPGAAGDTVPVEPLLPRTRGKLEALGYRASVRLEVLANDAIIGVPDLLAESPSEQALRIARLAHALADARAARSFAVVSGRVVVASGPSVGELVERAQVLLASAPAASIVLDSASVALLDARFEVRRDGDLDVLGAEKSESPTPRNLLGRRTPFVGRSRELALVVSTLEACVAESYARALLVSGAPGIGKSRLLSEVLDQARTHLSDARILVARGDPDVAGQPFGLIGQALRRCADIRADDGPSERMVKLRALAGVEDTDNQRDVALLGEMMGLALADAAHPQLRAARRDPPLMSSLLQEAFTDWVKRAAQPSGMLIALDDLHWADAPSVQLVDSALGSLADAPLFVLVLGRPAVREAYPRLFEGRDTVELKLGRLSKRASADLVTAILGAAASPALAAAIVERAEGNAFFLEELIRAASNGGLEGLPDTVLGVLESRLSDLEGDARLVLRAASVFGERAWQGGIEAVLGPESAVQDVAGWLTSLSSREILLANPMSRFAAQPEYGFRHALLRDASYATLPDHDRMIAHGRAAAWLEARGEAAAIVLAVHWERALEVARAASAYAQAVEQALRSNDLESAIALSERAERAGAAGEQLGRVRLLESEAYTWMGAPDQALRMAREAIALLPPGDPARAAALACAVEAAALLGQTEAAFAFANELTPSPASGTTAASEGHVAALGRVSFALVILGRTGDAARLLEYAEQMSEARVFSDPTTRAHLFHARAARAMSERKPEAASLLYDQAADAFEEGGALRLASGARANVAAMYLEMGAAARAVDALQRATAVGRGAAPYTIALAHLNRGIALTRLGRGEEAVIVLREVREELERQGDRRLIASCGCALAETLIVQGQLGDAEVEATRAVAATDDLPSCKAAALTMLGWVLLRKGDIAAASDVVRQADIERHRATMEEREVLLDLVLSQVDLASGDTPSARARLARLADDLTQRAQQIGSVELRGTFLSGVPEHRAVFELVASLSASETPPA